MITITLEANGFIKHLQKLEGNTKNLRPFFRSTGAYLIKKAHNRFKAGGIPKWRESVFGGSVLYKSGGLRDSIVIQDITESSLTVGTNHQNAPHNTGYNYIPKRGQRAFFFAWLKAQGLYKKGYSPAGGISGRFVNPPRPFLYFDPDDYQYIMTKLEQYIVKD